MSKYPALPAGFKYAKDLVVGDIAQGYKVLSKRKSLDPRLQGDADPEHIDIDCEHHPINGKTRTWITWPLDAVIPMGYELPPRESHDALMDLIRAGKL